MTYENAYKILKKLVNKELITEDMENEINDYAKWLISRMRDEVITTDEQAFLDLYINYLRLSLINMDLVSSYDKVIEEKNNPALNEEHKAQREGHHKVLLMEQKHQINSNGVILTTVILEVSLLLGLTLAILILALS